MVAYLDDFVFLLVMTALSIPLLMFMRSPRTARAAAPAPHVID